MTPEHPNFSKILKKMNTPNCYLKCLNYIMQRQKCQFLGCQKTDLKTVLYCQKCLYGVYNAQKPQNFPGAAPPTPTAARSVRWRAPHSRARQRSALPRRLLNATCSLRSQDTTWAAPPKISSTPLTKLLWIRLWPYGAIFALYGAIWRGNGATNAIWRH